MSGCRAWRVVTARGAEGKVREGGRGERGRSNEDAPSRLFSVKTSKCLSRTTIELTVCARKGARVSSRASRVRQARSATHKVSSRDAPRLADDGVDGHVEPVVVLDGEAKDGDGAVLQLRRERWVLQKRGQRKVLALRSSLVSNSTSFCSTTE